MLFQTHKAASKNSMQTSCGAMHSKGMHYNVFTPLSILPLFFFLPFILSEQQLFVLLCTVHLVGGTLTSVVLGSI